MKIKKGCIARCKAGMLGLVTSDSPQMTRYGKMAWIGVQLSADKAGGEWCSQDPELISESVEDLIFSRQVTTFFTKEKVMVEDLSNEDKKSILLNGWIDSMKDKFSEEIK